MNMRDRIKFILLIVGIISFNCSHPKKEQSPTINDSTVASGTYFMGIAEGEYDTIKLSSGFWDKVITDSEYVERVYMSLYKVAYGDLNNDNKTDAAVVLAQCTGGSGNFISINALVDSNGLPFHLACKYIGDRIKVDSVYIKDQIIHLNSIIQRYNAGACCPDSSVSWQFRLVGNKLNEIIGATF